MPREPLGASARLADLPMVLDRGARQRRIPDPGVADLGALRVADPEMGAVTSSSRVPHDPNYLRDARAPTETQKLRDKAFRTVEDINERDFTIEALQGCIKNFARHIYDLADTVDRQEVLIGLFRDVAHRAWHLMDDSGEMDTHDDNGVSDYMHCGTEHQRLSDALDALEAIGWDAHD